MHSASLETSGALTTLSRRKGHNNKTIVCSAYSAGKNYQGVKFRVKKVLGLPIWNSVAGRHYEVLFTFLTFLNIYFVEIKGQKCFDAQLERERALSHDLAPDFFLFLSAPVCLRYRSHSMEGKKGRGGDLGVV